MGGHPRYGFNASVFHLENYGGRKADPAWRTLEGVCPYGLFHITEDSIEWEREKCTNCLACIAPLMSRGLVEISESNFEACNAAIADACLATIKAVGEGKVAFINMAIDISPMCDCVNFSDMSLIPNLGVFAGFDPVAIDKACIDRATEVAGVKGSSAEDHEVLDPGQRKFESCSSILSGLSEEIQLNTGQIIGLGSRDYELVQVEERKAEDFAFPPDPRPVGVRFHDLFAKVPPFPRDRHDGQGYLREQEVDLDGINTYNNGSRKKAEARSREE
jgi:hypothetical protein